MTSGTPHPRTLAALSLALIAVSCPGEERVDFNRDIRPILFNRCVACHGPDEEERKADLRLDTPEGARADLGGYASLVPGDPEASELFYRITTDEEDDLMPPPEKGARFTEAEVELVRRWIEQGGDYAAHWSYQKPERPELPKTKGSWSPHPIDRFVLARLEREGLEPSPRAGRLVLARRISLDLTGLPPTWEEAVAFRDDPSPDALDEFVDRQLAKPAFGERWGRVWLDLARYADSAGYADDPARTIWAYRDYVIRSLNANMPFDRFTIEQIAGDLLESPTRDQLVATAFHRNTLTNSEGGTNDEEFRNVAVVDRVNTTMAVWMGTTMNCAQCHTHKYDPLTHHEYFQLFDFFNQSADADKKNEAPLLEIWTDEQRAKEKQWKAEAEAVREILSKTTPQIEKERESWTRQWREPFPWIEAAPDSLESDVGGLAVDESGWIRTKDKPEKNSYHLHFDLEGRTGRPIRGVRLRVSPDQAANFVLSRVGATWEPDEANGSVTGRFVRVELPGDGKLLQLAEVEVIGGGRNLALKKPAKASAIYADAAASRAVDGTTDGNYHAKSVFHSAAGKDPWFEVDLGKAEAIDTIRIWNRTDGGESISDRIAGYRVRVLDEKREEVFAETPEAIPSPSGEIAITGARNLPFSFASATHEQGGFPASAVLAGEIDPKKGWAIAGGTGKPQELLLVFSEPLDDTSGRLRLDLEQRSEHKQHVLTDFRVDLTGDDRVARWARIPGNVRGALRKEDPGEAEKKILAQHFQAIAPALAEERKQLAALEKQLAALKPTTTVPVMEELPDDKRRETHVHIRGNYQSHGDQVAAGVPAAFHPLRDDLPRNRLALAHWLVDEENPLTPRVLANRFWEQLFGIGLVETSEEFGSQGELPSHPELLDWLAVELRESGWDMKGFLKLIVTSETYCQDSKVTPELVGRDPFNRLLARGPRFRVSAEMVRDQALALAGLLSERMYGAPVKPPQPQLGLKAAFGSATDWETSKGEDRYRRGLYTMWRRSSPYPSMATFDAPNREVCTVRRTRTNTPLQALVTMNDPVYVEAAQAWGRKTSALPGSLEERLAAGLREALVREPSEGEVARLAELYGEALESYQADKESARLMAEEPIGAIPEGGDLASLAAWTVVGNVVLNLDELFLKR